MKNGWIYILAFLGFWTVLSERVTIASVIIGLIIAVAIYIYVGDSYKSLQVLNGIKLFPLWILFLGQLVSAIVIANFQVAYIVLSKSMPISPSMVEYKTKIKSELLKTILANSITLTPGTMSVDIQEDTLWIHCLNNEYAESLEGNVFEKTLMKIQEVSNDK